MVFGSPIWLMALLPWAAVAFYLLPGRGTLAVVPFVALWKNAAARSRRRARRWPSSSILLMLLALFLAVLAAAKPGVRSGAAIDGDLSIILDRGATMACASSSGRPLRGVLQRCVDRIGSLSSKSRVTLVSLPGRSVELIGQQWMSVAAHLPATVLKVDLDQAVSRQLQQTTGPVLVLSDQKIGLTNPRILQILPEPAGDDAAITALSVRSFPHPQAMVRIENHSDQKSIHLALESGDASEQLDVALPARGKSVDRFVDLKGLGTTVIAQLAPHAPADPWAVAFAGRQRPGIRIAVESAVDDAVKRIATIYQEDRPAGVPGQQVVILNHAIAVDQGGVWINQPLGVTAVKMPTVVVPHSITRNVISWPAVVDGDLPPDGFSPIVTTQRSTIVAVREKPGRQVWLNADLSDWEKTPDFVIFFGNVFDWLAGPDATFTATEPAELGDSWRQISSQSVPPGIQPGEWPGVYQSATTGQRVAVNSGNFPGIDTANPIVAGGNFPARAAGQLPLQSTAIFLSLAGLIAAILSWERVASKRRA